MRLPLSLPPALPSHRLGSKVTPRHREPSCASSGATLSPPWQLQAGVCARGLISGPTGAMRRTLAGAARLWHRPLFVLCNLSLSLSRSRSLEATLQKCVCGFVWLEVKHTLAVFPLLHYLSELWAKSMCPCMCVCVCVFADSCRECHLPKGSRHERQQGKQHEV